MSQSLNESFLENYFNYFTEIEDRFQQRRGSLLLLSTLDWALIETWKNAGIPLEAVLRGIDAAFDRYEQRKRKTRKVNSLAYCAQEVLAAAEEMKEASVGVTREPARLDEKEIAAFLGRNAAAMEEAAPGLPQSAASFAQDTARGLRDLAAGMATAPTSFEDIERRLTVFEEKLFAALLTATSDEELVVVRTEAEREMAPYRRNMPAMQIEQLQKQYVHKRLLQNYGVPRLSLFYM